MASLTIVKPLHEKYGDDKEAAANVIGNTGVLGTPTVSYQKKTGNTTWGTATTTAPTDAGTYKASITLGTGNDAKTAYVEYTIEKAKPSYTAPTGLTATYGGKLSDIMLTDGWEWDSPNTGVGDASTTAKKFSATYTPDDCDNYSTVTEELEVTVNKATYGDKTTSASFLYGTTKEFDLSGYICTDGALGEPAVSDGSGIIGSKSLSGNILSVTLLDDSTKKDKTATITIPVTSTNYANYNIAVTVTLIDITFTRVPAKAPTCTRTGNYEYYRGSDGNVYVLDENGDYKLSSLAEVTRSKRSHNVTYTVTKAATCTEAGEESGTCSNCGQTLTHRINALGHKPMAAVKENEVEATCTADGSYEEVVKCERCGEEISRTKKTIQALGHELKTTEEYIKEPTCTEPGEGYEVEVCERCGKEISRTAKDMPALGHKLVTTKENFSEAICTTPGRYDEVTKCERCGEEISRIAKETPALGHDPASAVEERRIEATCEKDGSYDSVVYCKRCGDEISRETVKIQALGHDLETVRVNESEATCILDGGYTDISRCKRCGKETERKTEVIPRLGHEFVNGVCTNCGAEEVKPGDLSGDLGKSSGEKVTLTLTGDGNTGNLTFPAADKTKEITIDGGDKTLEFTGSANVKPNQELTLANLTIKAEKGGKSQNITLTAASGGMTLENVTLDGKKTTISAKKGDLTLGDVEAKDLNVAGAKTTTLTVDGDVDVTKISGFGTVDVEGDLTVSKSLTVETLDLGAGGVITVAKGATITVSKGISGSGTIRLENGFKPLTIKGSISGKIKLTAATPFAEGTQILKSSLSNLNNVFDVTGIAPEVSDGEYEYGLYVKNNKAYLRAFRLQLGDKTYCETADLMSSISNAGDKSKTYEINILGDCNVGTLKLPKSGTYSSLTINGGGYTVTLSGTSLTLTGDLTLNDITIVSAKGAWTLNSKKYNLTADLNKLINCKIK